MSQRAWGRCLVGAMVGVILLSIAGWGSASLTLRFQEMEPHIGQRLAFRVIRTATGEELQRHELSAVPAGTFDQLIEGLVEGEDLQIDLFVDANDNGVYDAPPVDHAWRLALSSVQMDGVLTFVHTANFVDIDWPPWADGQVGEQEYRHQMTDASTGMTVHWQNDHETIYVALISPGTGWLALGFDPERRMMGANIIIAAINEDGDLIIADHVGTGQTTHREDSMSYILQSAGSQSEEGTIVEFAYPLETGDPADDPLLAATPVQILLAYHRSSDVLSMRHTARSTSEITLD